ncbi:hypothetical protein ACXIUS_28965 [Bosea thiooxidans]
MTNYDAEARKLTEKWNAYEGAYAAGGAITSIFTATEIRDVDVYFKSREAFELAVCQSYDEGLWCVSSSKRAVTFADQSKNITQLMHFDFFPTAQDIFKAFDYTICMGAYDYDTKEFVFHDDFLKHNSQRFLRFNSGTRYPLASATRVLKYQQRGYTIGKGDILKIVMASRGVTIDTWDDFKDQIGGAYGEKVLLQGEGQEFTIENAIAALTVNDAGEDKWIVAANDNQPGSGVELLRALAALKGEAFDESRFDADGWPVGSDAPDYAPWAKEAA